MMDEFAQYAKTERKINKLTEKLSQCSSARSLQVQCLNNAIEIPGTSKEKWYNYNYTQASKASWAFTLSMHACLGWPPKNSLSNCVEIWIWYKYIFVQAWAWWWQCGLGAASQSCFCLKPGSHPSHGNWVESHSPSNGPIMLSQSTAIFIYPSGPSRCPREFLVALAFQYGWGLILQS